jgi:hypothetical protein
MTIQALTRRDCEYMATNIIRQYDRCSGRHSSLDPPDYKSELLKLELVYSGKKNLSP